MLLHGVIAGIALHADCGLAQQDDADAPTLPNTRGAAVETPTKVGDHATAAAADVFDVFDMDTADYAIVVGSGISLLVVAFLGMFQRTRRRHLCELYWRARHDALTGLANRWAFETRLDSLLDEVEVSGKRAALLWIDLDNFKSANDAHGHAGGDVILATLAGRLRECVEANDTLARFGGDEFVILARRVDEKWEEGVFVLAQRILASVGAPIDVASESVILFASIGVSLIPEHGTEAQSLLAHANQAARRVKEDGGNDVRFFLSDERDTAIDGLALRSALAGAIDRGELALHYQPVVELATGKVSGVEALLRWNHPTLGEVGPDSFIPLAEDGGLIQAIGKWALHRACGQVAAWCAEGLPSVRMSVNLSPRQLASPQLPDNVASALRIHGVPANCLEFEVTEGAVMRDFEQAKSNMCALREMGLGLAVDDFGTGYSSLAYLRQLPVNRLKIDKAFIHAIADEGDDGTIAAAIIALAHKLGLEVVAEGVETRHQLTFLHVNGCEEVQGYYFGAARSATEIARLLGTAEEGGLAGGPATWLAQPDHQRTGSRRGLRRPFALSGRGQKR